MDHVARDAAVTSLPPLFEAAWSALWRRAEGAVGEVALESIAQLGRSRSVEKYPFLSPLKLESHGVSSNALLESAVALDSRELQEGLRFMLVEFLTVIGDLTDEILTPGLYAELSRIAPESEIQKSDQRGKIRPESRAVLENAKATAKGNAKEEDTAMTAKQNHGTKEHHATKERRDTMTKEPRILAKAHLLSTGIRTLDEMLSGGLVIGSSTALAGAPGSGKTILAQQIAFHNATPKTPVLFLSTLSEPGAKTLFYLNKFNYFDQKKIDECIHFVDLGILLRSKGLTQTLELIVERLEAIKPALVVVDSFKVFEDLTASSEELRKFAYELVVNLMTRKCTAFFLGEYAESEYERSPLFSIIDGLISMSQRELSGEHQRFIQIVKMRGLAHSRDEHSFKITADGVEIFAPRLTIKRDAPKEVNKGKTLLKTRVDKLDELLGGGIPTGSSLLVAGVAGTGKTVLGLEFVYRGALAGEKGIVFSFEETDARLRAAARGLGWDFDAQLESGMVKIIFIPQPDIQVENHLLMMQEAITSMGAVRVVIDSFSVFVHKIKDAQIVRDKIFQLATIVQNSGAVAFFDTDIPYGSLQMSRFGVEETVVDGVIVLSSTEEGLQRERYIEVYKLRNTAHLKGRHTMTIETGGITIFPRYRPQGEDHLPSAPAPKHHRRLSMGIAGLDKLLGSGLLTGSMTLVSGSSGIGKSVLALQFILEGALRGEPGLFVTLEEAPDEIMANAAALGLPLQKAVDQGLVNIIYLPPTHIRSTQLLALMTDRIKKNKTRRLALDSTTHIVAEGMSQDDVREQLYDMVVRFRDLQVTSVFTLESDLMYSTDSSTDTYRGFAPLADNVIVMRYVAGDRIASSIMVVKTRGSAHDNGLHDFHVDKGGLQIGTAIHATGATKETSGPTGDQQQQAANRGRRH
jgi:circadian clock protein KaiC